MKSVSTQGLWIDSLVMFEDFARGLPLPDLLLFDCCNPPRFSPSPQVVFLRLSSSWTETGVLYGRHRMWNSSAIELFQGSARDLR
jgi:hypothetical protein